MTDQPASAPAAPNPAPPAPPAPTKPAKERNLVGIIALVVAAVGFIFACIPGALIVGWILLPISFILGIVGVCLSGKVKWQALTAIIVAVIGTIVGFIVFFTVVANAVSDAFSDEVTVSEDTSVAVDEGTDGEDAADAEAGTRENPLPLGTTFENSEWRVVVNSVNLDAGAEIASANSFNDPVDPGSVYILINYTVTYIGQDADGQMPAWVGIEYVTAGGVSYDGLDKLVIGPDELDSMSTLYNGGTVTGNKAMQVPAPVDGVLAVSPGMFGDKVFVAVQ